MAIITKISVGVRRKDRANIYLDGKFVLSLSLDEVVKRGLAKGEEFDESSLGNLASVSEEEKIFEKIVNFISYRPRSKKEITERIKRYAPSLHEKSKDQILEKLAKLQLVNDREFAQWFVTSRALHRPRSSRHLRSELYAKGISKDIIEETVSKLGGDLEAIKKIISKKANLSRPKLIAHLARLGFSWELIKGEVDKDPDNE